MAVYTQFANNLTGDTNSPSPYVVTSSSVSSTNASWKAFDGNDTTYWQCNEIDGWLQIDCGTKKRVGQYNVLGLGAGNNPKNWTFLASQTGSFSGEETTLDTQTNQNTSTKKTYTISNRKVFRYYRIHVTAVDSSTSTIIKTLDLFDVQVFPPQIIWID